MSKRVSFDLDAYVTEISVRVAAIHNHPFHQHLIAMLAMEAKIYAEAQAILERDGILIVNNGSQESLNPAMKVSYNATQNILKLRRLLGLSRK